MYLKRQVYEKLLEWKHRRNHSTLEIRGARQVGKTYLINRFADENFRKKIYINLFELSGKQFMECYERAVSWEPGQKRSEHPLQDAVRLYETDFEDSEDTIIIIDEIQESAELYNRIREFTRQFRARFVVTGSYLGKIYDPDFRYSSGDVTTVTIYTLSFAEFLRAYDEGLYEKYMVLDQNPEPKAVHEQLKDIFWTYCQVGGYPKVVESYLANRSLQSAQEELVKIVDTFTNESIRYFTDILDARVFTQIFFSICRILGREKKGLAEDSISEELQKLVQKDYSSNISKAVCNRAISWLHFSGLIGFCGKITELDILDFKPACRCYFMDPGLANYYMQLTGITSSERIGTLHEDYVYINLKKRQDHPAEITFETPAFATYKGGEIDFVVQSIVSDQRYLLEVKTGHGTAPTAQRALQHGKADMLLYLRGTTGYGKDGKTETLPLYMLEQYRF